MSLGESRKGVVLQRDGSLHLKNSHSPEVESGIHNHDSLLGLGWLLRLLIVWNDKVNGRFRLLEENSQLDLNLLGPEKKRYMRRKGHCMSIEIYKRDFFPCQRNKNKEKTISLWWWKEY